MPHRSRQFIQHLISRPGSGSDRTIASERQNTALATLYIGGSRRYFFCGSFLFLFCLVFAMSLCASVYMCFVDTCWERADLLASTVSLSLSHWYPGSDVVLDCIDS